MNYELNLRLKAFNLGNIISDEHNIKIDKSKINKSESVKHEDPAKMSIMTR